MGLAVNSRKKNAGGPREAVNNRGNSAEGARKAVNNRSNSARGTRKVVYNMRISAGGAREVGNIRRNSAREARDFDNMNNTIEGANDAVNNRSNSIGVAMGIALFSLSILESQMKLLMHSAICDFVNKLAVRLYMVSLKTGKDVQADLGRKNLNGAERLRIGKCYLSRLLCHLHP